MELGHEKVECDDRQIVLSGRVVAPVGWDYIMYLPHEEWDGFFRTALRPQMATFLLERSRLMTLGKLMVFLAKFVPAYLAALFRIRLGLGPKLADEVTATPDLEAEAEIVTD
jgi:hypothetical protein